MTTATPTVVVGDLDTPVGRLRIAERAGRLVALAFADHFDRVAAPVRRRFPEPWEDGTPASAEAVARYFDGELDALDDVEVDWTGTPFRTRVWEALRAIPVGETRSYADVAAAVGAPGAVRAVGSANGANPIWVVVPCHRVVRADGSLGGYGGGPERKAWLLAHEGAASGETDVTVRDGAFGAVGS